MFKQKAVFFGLKVSSSSVNSWWLLSPDENKEPHKTGKGWQASRPALSTSWVEWAFTCLLVQKVRVRIHLHPSPSSLEVWLHAGLSCCSLILWHVLSASSRLCSLIFTTQKSRYNFSHLKNVETDALQRLCSLPLGYLQVLHTCEVTGVIWAVHGRKAVRCWTFSDKHGGAKRLSGRAWHPRAKRPPFNALQLDPQGAGVSGYFGNVGQDCRFLKSSLPFPH